MYYGRHMYSLPVMKQWPQAVVVKVFQILPAYVSKPEAPVFLRQQFCALRLLVYHFGQTRQPYIWHCVTLLFGGLASAAATERWALWHYCTIVTASAHNTKTRKKQTRTENDVAAASVAGGGLKPKLCQYPVMTATHPTSPGSDVCENYVYSCTWVCCFVSGIEVLCLVLGVPSMLLSSEYFVVIIFLILGDSSKLFSSVA